MKASEIINDDVLSRERRKSKEVYDKKSTSNDYFGDKRSTKRVDRDLVAKDADKSVTKKKVDESVWKEMGFTVRSDYTWPAMMLESANTSEYNEFNSWINKRRDSQAVPEKGSTGILAMILFTGDMIMITCGPAKYIGQTNTHYILQIPDGIHEYSKKNQIFFNSKESFDKFITLLNLKFLSANLKIKINTADLTETNKSVEEGSMQSATHKPEGAKFGGYWKGTDAAPPKPGQGVGGAA